MPLGMEVGLGPGDFVFDGDTATPRKKAHHPTQFLAHVYCGQTAGWINMPFSTDVNLGPSDVVLDGVAAPHRWRIRYLSKKIANFNEFSEIIKNS